jgi:hypothetical protein
VITYIPVFLVIEKWGLSRTVLGMIRMFLGLQDPDPDLRIH